MSMGIIESGEYNKVAGLGGDSIITTGTLTVPTALNTTAKVYAKNNKHVEIFVECGIGTAVAGAYTIQLPFVPVVKQSGLLSWGTDIVGYYWVDAKSAVLNVTLTVSGSFVFSFNYLTD